MKKTRGLIAAGHIATAEAAATILRAGGNAFDAAVAGLLASFVSEPCMSSAGGGAFLTAYRPEDRSAVAYDCFVQTPHSKRPPEQIEFLPIEIDFGTAKETFYIGMGSVAVPGTIAGAWKIHADFGSIPMSVIAEPAIHLAKYGVPVDSFQEHDFNLLEPILEMSKPSEVFWRGDRLIQEGEIMTMPEFADCLDHLVREGRDEFYRGEVAKLILQLNAAKGGHLTAEDLAAYEALRRTPLRFPYRDRQILTNPLPSLGGSLIGLVMGQLAKGGAIDFEASSPEEVARFAPILYALDKMPKTAERLALELERMYPGIAKGSGSPSNAWGGTSHFSILDEHGNAVSVTTSNGEGCGHFVPGTGIILNNMLGETALLPNGLHSWAPSTRLGSMMSPTIVLNAEQEAEAVIGSGGAGRIPFMLAQVIYQLIDQGKDVFEAVEAPRMHAIDGVFNLEPGLPFEGMDLPAFERILPWESRSLYFGGVHAVLKRKGSLQAQGDARRGGVTLEVS